MENEIKSTMVWDGHAITMTWIKTDGVENFSPITQYYGICFNQKGEILIIREPGKKWQLPGGTPEAGEKDEDTIKREFTEEADTVVKNIKPLGVQKVEFPNNPNVKEGELYFQSRYICELEQLNEQTPDPDINIVWDRKFVPSSEITEYIKWGELGEAMFRDAIALANESYNFEKNN